MILDRVAIAKGRFLRLSGLVLALTLLLLLSPTAALAVGTGSSESPDATIIRLGEDVRVFPTESVETVVAFGGNIIVEGKVRGNVIAFGGDIEVRDGAVVGDGMTAEDFAVISFGGSVSEAAGADVVGKTVDLASLDWVEGTAEALGAPFRRGSATGWAIGLAFWLLLAVLAARLTPRQVEAVSRHLELRPLSSLGWGALGALIIFPLITLLLVITVVGIFAAVPLALFIMPILFLAGYLAAAGILGQRLLRAVGSAEPGLIAITMVGVVILEVLALVPILGALLLGLVWLAGFGATVAALRDWGQKRREGRMASPAPTTNSGQGKVSVAP